MWGGRGGEGGGTALIFSASSHCATHVFRPFLFLPKLDYSPSRASIPFSFASRTFGFFGYFATSSSLPSPAFLSQYFAFLSVSLSPKFQLTAIYFKLITWRRERTLMRTTWKKLGHFELHLKSEDFHRHAKLHCKETLITESVVILISLLRFHIVKTCAFGTQMFP